MNTNGYTSTYLVLEMKRQIKEIKVKLKDKIKYRKWYQNFINKNAEKILSVTDETERKYLLDTDLLVAKTIDAEISKLKYEIKSIGLKIVRDRQKVFSKIKLDSYCALGCSKDYVEKYLNTLKQNQKRINEVEINQYGK